MSPILRLAPPLLATAALLLSARGLGGQELAGTTFTVSGEVRVRSEAARPATPSEWDNFTLLRTRIGVLATVNPSVRAFAQVQDSRVFGEEPNTLGGAARELDLHQGWVELSGTVAGAPVALRAGRQEINLGNERLVGAVGWSNTGRSFDAGLLTLGGKDTPWKGGAFLATVHEGGNRYRGLNGQGLDDDHWVTGLFAGRGGVEAYALFDDDAHWGPYAGTSRATLGARLQTPQERRFTGSLEGYWQTGSQDALIGGSGIREQDIAAFFAAARVGAKTGAAVLPSVGLGVDYLSGDDDPLDDDYSAFNTLYATNHKWYGYLDLFLDPAGRTGGRGLVDGIAQLRAGLGPLGTLDLDVHRFSLAESAGLDESLIGWELDVTYPFRIADAARVSVGYSAFRNGGAAPAIGLGDDGDLWHWGYVQLSAPF